MNELPTRGFWTLKGPATLNAGSPPAGGDSDLVRYDAVVESEDGSMSETLTNKRPKRLIENTQWRPGADGVWLEHNIFPDGSSLTVAIGEELITGACP